MTKDRLAEFQAKRDEYERESQRGKKKKKTTKEEEEDEMSLKGFLDKVKVIEGKIKELKNDVETLKKLQDTLYCAPFVQERDLQKMEIQAGQIHNNSVRIRKDIELLSTNGTSKSPKKGLILSDAEQRVQGMQIDRLSHELKTIMNDFRSYQASYLEKTKARLNKQRQIISPTDADNNIHIEMDMESQAVFTGGYIQQMQKARTELQDLQEREKELSELESQIHEVNQLFKEMHGLVHEQGEMIDNIEKYVETAVDDVNKGNQNLEDAKDYQCKARKKKIICIVILVVILIIVGIIIAVTVTNNSGDS